MKAVWLTPPWRRTVLALVFAAAGAVLTGFAFWLAWNVLNAPWPTSLAAARLNIIGVSLYAVLGLLGLVLTGLAMTVALRSVSAKFAGIEAGITGGNHDDGPEQPESEEAP
jgi:ABC-type multidrug transport system fused ATPase/permease subunit